MFEDPTAGVDVGAKAEIYRLFDVALQGRRGDPHRLDRFRGSIARSATARWCSIAAACVSELHGRDLSISNLLAAASANIERRPPLRPEDPRPMQSIKSNALEPTRPELASLTSGPGDPPAAAGLWPADSDAAADRRLFSILLPDTFPTWLNCRSILADKSIVALLALAATLPMMAGRIDLTVGFGIVMWHILAISLQV